MDQIYTPKKSHSGGFVLELYQRAQLHYLQLKQQPVSSFAKIKSINLFCKK